MPDYSRRTLLTLAPTIATLIASEAGLEAQQKVSKDQLKNALEIIGLDFTEAQREQMLAGVNRSLSGYEALRKIDVPLDTEPAFHFRPSLPGKEPKARVSKFLPTRVVKLVAFKDAEELCFLPVTELSALVRARKITSTDLTKMYLARLKKYSPKLLCVITLTEELALEQAARADQEIAAGRYRGALHGIPYGAKDLFNTKGIKTTWGAEPFQEQVPAYTCTAIERLEKAGAVLLAKLSMGALAQGDKWFGGVTKNPWNLEQGSSGSSAGSASATSAGLVGFSIGTETLGSIVSPSTRCGVTGLRPTYGRVSRYGAMGLSWTMDKIGPICRSVEDTALVLHAMYGPDGHDVTTIDAPFDWNPAVPLGSLKIGYLKSEFERTGGFGQQANPETIAARKKIYADVFEVLKKAGAKIEAVELPQMNAQPLSIILNAEAGAAFDDITRDGRVTQLSGQANSDWPNSFRQARMIPAVEYIRAMRERTLLQEHFDAFMKDWDVLIVPTGTATLQITNLTGHPQVAVPCGFLNGNNPQSVLFTGRLYEEGTALRVAHAFEQGSEWHKMHPKVDWA